MKKLFLITIAVILAMPFGAQGAQYRKKLKEYKRAGWELYASSQTMKDALRNHYKALEREGTFEVVGTANGIQNESVGRQLAWTNACISYVQQAGNLLRGRVDTDGYTASGKKSDFVNFYAAFETLLQKEIRGEMKPSFTLIRYNDDGTSDIMSFFVVDEEAAVQARIRAMEHAAKESEAARNIASRIREFVKEGFSE